MNSFLSVMTQPTLTKAQVQPLVDQLVAKIAARERVISDEMAANLQDKIGANTLCRMAGLEELYKMEEGGQTPTPFAKPTLKIGLDQFVNKELSVAVSTYLEMRKLHDVEAGPATIDQIYDALLAGGFKFGGTTDNPSNHKRAMNIALTRNTAQMHKINENTFGLRRWYGMRAARKMAPTLAGDYQELSSSPPTSAVANAATKAPTPEPDFTPEDLASFLSDDTDKKK